MDNSIGTMFLTLLNAAMQPLVERIDLLEKEVSLAHQELATQDKLIQVLDKRADGTQSFNGTSAGIMTQVMEALTNGAGPYREFCTFIEDSIQESQTIRTLKEQLPGDTSDISENLWTHRQFKDELVSFLDMKGYPSDKEVQEMIDEADISMTESDVRGFANEEINECKFVEEDDLDSKVREVVRGLFDDVTVTLSLD